jgi:hypothetical protein
VLFDGGNPATLVNAGTLIKSGAGTTTIPSGVALTNTGTIVVSAGNTLQVNSFAQTALGVLQVHIGGPTANQQGRLSTTNSTLDGTLDLTLDAGYTPGVGTIFTPVTYVTRTGTFATIDGNDIAYSANYGVNALSLTVGAGAAARVFDLPGDFNFDGSVDAADYVVFRKEFGAIVSPFSSPDGNGDGVVNAADYGVWRANFGKDLHSSEPAGSVVASAAAVSPEDRLALPVDPPTALLAAFELAHSELAKNSLNRRFIMAQQKGHSFPSATREFRRDQILLATHQCNSTAEQSTRAYSYDTWPRLDDLRVVDDLFSELGDEVLRSTSTNFASRFAL